MTHSKSLKQRKFIMENYIGDKRDEKPRGQ